MHDQQHGYHREEELHDHDGYGGGKREGTKGAEKEGDDSGVCRREKRRRPRGSAKGRTEPVSGHQGLRQRAQLNAASVEPVMGESLQGEPQNQQSRQ